MKVIFKTKNSEMFSIQIENQSVWHPILLPLNTVQVRKSDPARERERTSKQQPPPERVSSSGNRKFEDSPELAGMLGSFVMISASTFPKTSLVEAATESGCAWVCKPH